MTTPSASLPLANLAEKGRAPKQRIDDANEARELVSHLIHANRERSRANAKIKGMLDGNPPYDRNVLAAKAQKWRCNVNFLEGKAALSAALVPYYDLFSGAREFVQVRTKAGRLEERVAWSKILSEEMDWLLRQYYGFDFHIQSLCHDMVTFGKGFLFWPDRDNWQFRHVHQSKVLVPDGTDAFAGNLEVMIVRERMAPHQLYRYIKDAATATASGWKVPAVRNAIWHAQPDQQDGTSDDYELYQQRINDHDLFESVRSSVVKIAHVYVAEFDGSVSHLIVEERNRKKENDPEEFLFEDYGRFGKFQEVICPFFLETLDGSWNGAAGLGKDIYAPMELKNRLKCSAADLTFLRSNISLQARTANALQKTALVQAGAFNIIPPDYEVLQSTILGDVTTPIAFDRMLDQMLSSNTGVYRQRMDKPEGNPRTAREVELQYQTQAVLGNSAVNRYYLNLDNAYEEIWRRVTETEPVKGVSQDGDLVLEFRQRLKDRGVPVRALEEVDEVMAFRVSGNGSAYLRQQQMGSMMTFLPLLPEAGRQNFLEDAVALLTNQSMVERYVPPAALLESPTDHQSIALLENAALRIGAPVVWTPTQNNVIHATAHLKAAGQALQSIQAGADPVDVLRFVDGIVAHVPMHLEALQGDPIRKGEREALVEQWKEIAAAADELRSQVEQLAQEQQRNGEMQQQAMMTEAGRDPDVRRKDAVALSDVRRKDMKAQADLQRRAVKDRQGMMLADLKTSAGIRLQQRKNEQHQPE